MRGVLGKATDDFCEDGRLVEKTTYGENPGESQGAGGVGAPALHPNVGHEGPSNTLRHTREGCLLGAGTRDSVS